MGVPLRVLIVEDSEIDFLMLAQELRRGGYDPVCERVETGDAMSAALDRGAWDVILIDYTLPHFSGIGALELVKRKHIDLPAIIVSGTIDDATAVTAMKAGAHDYIMKNNLARLIPAIEREMHETKGRQERRRIEKLLQETEKKFFTVFQHSPVPIAITSIEEGRFFDVNEQYTRMTEFPQEELIGHTSVELNLWADPGERKKYLESLERNHGKIQSYPVSVRTKSGNVINVLFSADIIKINNAPYLLSSAVDITDRQKAEEILKTQAHILDRMAEGVNLADEKGFIASTNPAYDSIFGYECGELIGKHVSILNVGSSADNIRLSNEIIQELKTSGVWSGEFANRKKDGTPLTTRARISALEVSGKQFWVTVQDDITARKKLEEALRSAEENFRHSLENSPLGVRIATAEGETIYVNQAILDYYGYDSIDELRTMPLKDLYTPESYAECQVRKEKRKQGDNVPSEYEVGIVRKDGEVRQLQVLRKTTLWNGEQQFQVIYQDITERKRLEHQLSESEKLYRTLFNEIDEGFCIIEVIFDENEKPIDYRFLSINPSFEKQTGLVGAQGKRMRELAPKHEEHWFEIYGEIAVTGRPARFVYRAEQLHRWYDVYAFRFGQPENRQVAVLFNDITERKQMEKELYESEERYRALFEHSMDAALLTTADGKIITANPAACRLFGYTEEELIRIGRAGVTDAADARLAAALSERERTGIFKGELTCVRKDKTRFPVELSSTTFRDREGTVLTSMLIRDLGERKKMEVALRESETRFRELFEHMNNGVTIYQAVNDGKDFLITGFNKAGERICQVARDEIIGKSLQEIFPGVRRMGILDALARVWKTGRSELLPAREYQDQRISLWVENYVYRLPSGEIVTIYEDITVRKQAEEALARSEEQYRSLATTADLMYLVDREGRYLFLNDGYMKRIGLPKEQVIGRFYSDFYSEEATEMFMDSVKKVFDTENVYQREHASTRDGKIFLITYSPVQDSLGQVRAVTIVSKDITERKMAENALRVSREQLRAFAGRLQATREEERTQIAREIHDEMGGALTAMKIDSSLLARAVTKVRDKALKNSLQARIGETTKLIDATMQTVRRIATGLRPGVLDDLGLMAALEWQLADFQKRTGIRCAFTSSADCADLDQNRATALFRIAQEALTNVARHARATEVRVRLSGDVSAILLGVEDNGVGIKEEEIRNVKSLGILGMRERALSFGGRVTITGRPGEGTMVAVESPLAGRGVRDQETDA